MPLILRTLSGISRDALADISVAFSVVSSVLFSARLGQLKSCCRSFVRFYRIWVRCWLAFGSAWQVDDKFSFTNAQLLRRKYNTSDDTSQRWRFIEVVDGKLQNWNSLIPEFPPGQCEYHFYISSEIPPALPRPRLRKLADFGHWLPQNLLSFLHKSRNSFKFWPRWDSETDQVRPCAVSPEATPAFPWLPSTLSCQGYYTI